MPSQENHLPTKPSTQQLAPLASCQQAQKSLAICLTKCIVAMKSYHRTANDLEHILPVFMEVLGEYNKTEIERAFLAHMKAEKEFPTPSEIYQRCKRMRPLKQWEIESAALN